MLPIALNPYFDDVLRRHLAAAASRVGLQLTDLERAFSRESDAIQFLREQSEQLYIAYEEEASDVVDHVGWIVLDERGLENVPRVPKR